MVADLLQEINAYSFRCVEHYSLFDDHAASVVNIHFTRPKKNVLLSTICGDTYNKHGVLLASKAVVSIDVSPA